MAHPAPTITSPPWTATTKRLVALVALTLAFLIARQVNAGAWTAIIVSVLLAYLLSPVVTFFEGRLRFINSYEWRRTLAVLLTWLVVIGLFALVLGLVVPATVSQLRQFADDLPDLIANTEQDLKTMLDRPITIGDQEIVPWEELERAFIGDGGSGEDSSITSTLQDAVLSLADPALGLVGGLASFLIDLFFVLTMLFYLMRDGPVFAQYLVGSAPESYQGDVRRLFHELAQVWNAYLRGQILLGLVIAVAVYINALILGLPQPLLLALVAGFLEFIPNLGPALSQIPALLFALTTDSATMPGLDAGLGFAVVVSLSYIVIQQLEAMFLVPRIMGRSLDLHPFVVLVSILIGASLAGVLGVVLAAPIAATLRTFARYLRGKLLDEDPFATGEGYSMQQRGIAYALIRFFLSKRFPTLPPEPVTAPDPDDYYPPSDDPPSEYDDYEARDMSGWLDD
ncbi:MAG: AI-2E family transporter [Anaerolineae bacterium]|nr:AI-2E family transporter [Anaerolineae bacterium]